MLLLILTPSFICLDNGSWKLQVFVILNLTCFPRWWILRAKVQIPLQLGNKSQMASGECLIQKVLLKVIISDHKSFIAELVIGLHFLIIHISITILCHESYVLSQASYAGSYDTEAMSLKSFVAAGPTYVEKTSFIRSHSNYCSSKCHMHSLDW